MANFSKNTSHHRLLSCVAALSGLMAMNAAKAETLWYNGDLNYQSGLISTDSPDVVGIVYDDFNVTSTYGWNVNGVSGNFYNTMDLAGSTANWEIRSGVSSGNPGTLVASGTSSFTVTQLGTIGTSTVYNVQNVAIAGLNVNLSPGTYWLGLQPITTAGYGYLGTTVGSNAVGTPPGNDSNAFATRPDLSQYFTPTTDLPAAGHDYSLSVSGTTAVPEPSQWIVVPLVGLGLVLWKSRAALKLQPQKITSHAPSPRRR